MVFHLAFGFQFTEPFQYPILPRASHHRRDEMQLHLRLRTNRKDDMLPIEFLLRKKLASPPQYLSARLFYRKLTTIDILLRNNPDVNIPRLPTQRPRVHTSIPLPFQHTRPETIFLEEATGLHAHFVEYRIGLFDTLNLKVPLQ